MYIQKTAKCKVAPAHQKYKKRWKSKNIKNKNKNKNTNYKRRRELRNKGRESLKILFIVEFVFTLS